MTRPLPQTLTRLALLVAAAGLMLGATSEAQATVKCEVVVIHATGTPGAARSVDPALKKLSSYLDKSFGARYSTFKQVARRGLALERDRRGTMKLPNERELALTFKGVADGFLQIFLELPHIKMTVKIRDGGLFFQAGHAYKGGMLILAIRAKQG